ncbi:MAG: helix-turn-helix domain-containing protein [Ruminococcaceae bacterium]|nr:helix-turn-helix domain-containing protein [Oscillospiraceae bacterium]
MEMKKQITNRDLAAFFMEKTEKEEVLNALFDFFGFDCMARCGIDPGKLDARISEWEKSGYSDTELLTEIIGLMHAGKDTVGKREKALLEEIRSYVTKHLEEDISIEETAAALNVSYYYICHFFKQQTGMSLSTFKNQKRMEKAIRELSETDKKIAEIAAKCGFNNVSYFTEMFTKMTGLSPSRFRSETAEIFFHSFYEYEDMLLAAQLGGICFLKDVVQQENNDTVQKYPLFEPEEGFGFLHETAIIEYKGVLYASWYNCPDKELMGYTPICGRRSFDGGKTWTDMEIIAEDKTEKILFCPPVYGICEGSLYMLVNEMVAPDHMHALDLYVLNEEPQRFEFVWSRPIPFKLNTNVVTLPNGKLMLPGRVAKLDGFPNTPAVMISDSGKIDAEWRLVKIAENGDLPDGKKLVHPEISVICCADTLYMFNRDDQRRVPLVYISKDFGESWSTAKAHDIPYVSSKIYCGTLTDGRNYLIANTDNFDRSKLVLYLSEKDTVCFEHAVVLFDGKAEDMPGVTACHYPAATESDGKLYIIATKNYSWSRRGAEVFVVDLEQF